jgi:hypothetical protein
MWGISNDQNSKQRALISNYQNITTDNNILGSWDIRKY